MKAVRLFICVASFLLMAIIHSISARNASCSGIDSVEIKGDDIEDVDDSQDIFSDSSETAVRSISTSPDTLYAYTLTGLRLDGRRNSNSRTLYNIIIRNGRKVVKR